MKALTSHVLEDNYDRYDGGICLLILDITLRLSQAFVLFFSIF